MGACQSTNSPKAEAEKERSDQIDQELHEDYKKAKRECKILLLGEPILPHAFSIRPVALHPGSGESGKSTIVKQMKILHKDGFSDTERAEYRIIIYRNLLESGRAIVNQMRVKLTSPKIKFEPEELLDKEHEV
jgi:guanine nucleotide-binding protein subunit alpha